MKQRQLLFFVLSVAVRIAAPSVSVAQSHPEYIALGRISAALYKPDKGPAPHVRCSMPDHESDMRRRAFVRLVKRGAACRFRDRASNSELLKPYCLPGTTEPRLSRTLLQHAISEQ